MTRQVGLPQTRWHRSGTSLRRRDAIAGLGACLAGGLIAPRAAPQAAGTCVLTPDSGDGPFYFDPELVRVDIAESRPGTPLQLTIQVTRAADCATLVDARVDVWHADALGLYSGYERQPGTGAPAESVAGQTFLRGTQFTDRDGRVRFRTIYPSWYRGRTPHIHFKAFLGGNEVVASQMFFPEDVNRRIFERDAPYRDRRERQDTFNATDTFLTGRTAGVFCSVEERAGAQRAELVIALRAA